MQIPIKLIRRLRSVFRRAINARSRPQPVVWFLPGPTGARIHCRSNEAAVEFEFPDATVERPFAVPLDALQDFEGKSSDEVSFEPQENGIAVSWSVGGVPQRVLHALDDKEKIEPLDRPETTTTLGAGDVISLFDELAQTAASDRTRYALDCIQLRGQAKEAVATNGTQLLAVSDLPFPWDDDVLVPTTKFFAAREIAGETFVSVGRAAHHVAFTVGPWTLWLPIQADVKFPNVDQVIPASSAAKSTIEIDAHDAEFLAHSVEHLPQPEVFTAAVTLECNGKVAVRSKEREAAGTELVLSKSNYRGEAIKIGSDRSMLRRAASLGANRIHIFHTESPVLATNGDGSATPRLRFVWQPIKPQNFDANDIANVIDSSTFSPASRNLQRSPNVSKRPSVSSSPTPNAPIESASQTSAVKAPAATAPDSESAAASDPTDSFAEIDGIKSHLRLAVEGIQRLSKSLRRERRANRLLRSTLASLRDLREVG